MNTVICRKCKQPIIVGGVDFCGTPFHKDCWEIARDELVNALVGEETPEREWIPLDKVKEPMWTAETMNRKEGSTTFQMCGWCDYTGSGRGRYGCMLTSNCILLKMYGKVNSQMENTWDTPCLLRKLGRRDAYDLIRYQKMEIKMAENRIKQYNENIAGLQRIQYELKDRPPLPNSREVEHHVLGEICYVFHNRNWERGTVVQGYRTHDGCVSFVLDNYPDSRGGEKGPWGCGMSVPHILMDWEFDYFREHPDEFGPWLELCDDKLNQDKLDRKGLLEALQKISSKQAIPDDDVKVDE